MHSFLTIIFFAKKLVFYSEIHVLVKNLKFFLQILTSFRLYSNTPAIPPEIKLHRMKISPTNCCPNTPDLCNYTRSGNTDNVGIRVLQFSAVWLFIFGHPVFIYSAVWFRPSGPDSTARQKSCSEKNYNAGLRVLKRTDPLGRIRKAES